MLYVNSGANHQAMFDDARAQQKKEATAWPYDWVAGVDYPHRAERATVKGQFALNDPEMPGGKFSRVMIGLVAPDYISPRGPGPNGAPAPESHRETGRPTRRITSSGRTATDRGQASMIPNVRPGKYSLRAFADGVLGEFVRDDVTVEPGKALDLGKIAWHARPPRSCSFGTSASPTAPAPSFSRVTFIGSRRFSLDYARLFTNDVNYVGRQKRFSEATGISRQVPHNENPDAKAVSILRCSKPRSG